VAFLVSSRCATSGLVLSASDGHFAAERWISQPGVNFGRKVITPEDLVEQWQEIMGA
jgi:hypothetical protein